MAYPPRLQTRVSICFAPLLQWNWCKKMPHHVFSIWWSPPPPWAQVHMRYCTENDITKRHADSQNVTPLGWRILMHLQSSVIENSAFGTSPLLRGYFYTFSPQSWNKLHLGYKSSARELFIYIYLTLNLEYNWTFSPQLWIICISLVSLSVMEIGVYFLTFSSLRGKFLVSPQSWK